MMKTKAIGISAAFLMCIGSGPSLRAATGDAGLRQAAEVISVLKSNYVDRDKLDGKLLDAATVAGILQALGSGAVIVAPEPATTNDVKTAATPPAAEEPLARAEVIEPDIGYIRLADVTADTVVALDAELKKFAEEKVSGFVLDLRFADGTNYAAAAAVASRFLNDGQELFTLKSSEKGTQVFRATKEAKSAPEGLELASAPLMLLVNAETRGSAEAVAGALRAQDRGILIGAKTAGAAACWKDVSLSNGQTLRLATAKVVLPAKDAGTGMATDVFPNGIAPDVAVKIDSKIERDTVLAAQTNSTLTASLQPRVQNKGLTEAELVKAFHGQAIEAGSASTNKEGEEQGDIQRVRDVVLQRAVDILKGIRMLLSSQ